VSSLSTFAAPSRRFPALAAVHNLSAWVNEHHAKLVHAFVTRTQVSAPALVPLGHDAEVIGFAWPR
jgi:hypothetical protein